MINSFPNLLTTTTTTALHLSKHIQSASNELWLNLQARNDHTETLMIRKISAEGNQRRVWALEVENHNQEGSSDLLSRKQQGDKTTTSRTISAPQRQPLLEVNQNRNSTSNPGLFLKKSQQEAFSSSCRTLSVSRNLKSLKHTIRTHQSHR